MLRLLCFFRLTLHWEAAKEKRHSVVNCNSMIPETKSRLEDERYQDVPLRDCCVTPRGQDG